MLLRKFRSFFSMSRVIDIAYLVAMKVKSGAALKVATART